ncbi:MAG: hypothetical protein QM756_10885 [Polyangiaceae bacterium]
MRPSTKSLIALGLTLAAALAPALYLWGFTVDDALISARVAHQLATGHGYRFNAEGAPVDAVTPLGWAPLLAGFASAGPLAALSAAKWLGLVSWLAAVGWLGRQLSRFSTRGLVVGPLLLAANMPLAVWSVAGMETGVVIALATLGLAPNWAGRSALGLAAAWRPELLPWAATMAAGPALFGVGEFSARLRRAMLATLPVLLPFACVAVVRTWVFGAAYPLSVLAKPPDGDSGLRYALGALAFSGPAWALIGGRALLGLSARARVTLVAGGLHVVALCLVGGDWMPIYRLFAPILPSLILAAAELAEHAPTWISAVRVTAALSASGLLFVGRASSARGVGVQRMHLIEASRSALQGAQRVATLDVGWVGASTAASVVDMAGVTDPWVARLPGGHTTKKLPDSFLEARDVDALVLLAEVGMSEACSTSPDGFCPVTLDWVRSQWPALHFVRAVEARVVTLTGADRFRPVALVALWGTRQAYVIARRNPAGQP